MSDFSTMTTVEMERKVNACTRQLDALAAQQTGIRRAIQNGRGNDAMLQQQKALNDQQKALRQQKEKLQQALTERRNPTPTMPQAQPERYDMTAGLAAARQRETTRG